MWLFTLCSILHIKVMLKGTIFNDQIKNFANFVAPRILVSHPESVTCDTGVHSCSLPFIHQLSTKSCWSKNYSQTLIQRTNKNKRKEKKTHFNGEKGWNNFKFSGSMSLFVTVRGSYGLKIYI